FSALFELRRSKEQTAVNVLNTALITSRFFEQNRIYRSKFGVFEFGVKVGIGFGHCYSGIVGSCTEKSYYFSGPAVDLCAMAEHNAEKGDVWISGSAFKFLKTYIKSSKTNSISGHVFYRVDKVKPLKPETETYKTKRSEKELIHTLAGRPESEFPVGEFRNIISVFISFEGNVDLQELMEYIYKLKDDYGSSHPVIDFGDKGGNILLFFGAPVSFENNSFRALSLILKILEFAAGDFKLRAGLAKGVVYCGFNGSDLRNEFTCLGNTVNQSARFMMKADWGQIFIDQELAREKNFVAEHIDDIQYKGRKGLIPTYRLIRKIDLKDIFFKGGFVGRKRQKRRIKKFLDPLFIKKDAGTLYIDGEAGIGKSRLVNQIRREILNSKDTDKKKIEWLYFVCDDVIKDPYNPLKYFFKRYFDLKDGDRPEKNLAKFFSELKYELKEHREYLAFFLDLPVDKSIILSQDSVERQNNIILALLAFFKAVIERSPVVFEIDNAAFIDQYSLEFFQRLAFETKRDPTAFIFNCRYKDNGDRFDFGLVKQKRLKLKELSMADLGELVEDRLKTNKIPAKTFRLIKQKSAKNPFFAEQIIHFLEDNSILDKKFNIISEKEIPSGLEQIVIARVDKLSAELKEILKTASVQGNEIMISILTDLFKNKYGSLNKYFKMLESEDIWILFNEFTYLFKMSVMRDVIYQMQLKKTLRKIHDLTGKSIENLFKKEIDRYYSTLAFHFDNAENIEKALKYHKKAGYKLRDAYQNKAASEHFDRWTELFLSKYKNELGESELTKEGKRYIDQLIEVCLLRFHFHFAIFQDMNTGSTIIDELLKLYGSTKNDLLRALIKIDHANLLSYQGKTEEANSNLNTSRVILEKLEDNARLTVVNLAMGKNFMATGNFDKALEFYNKGLTHAKKVKKPVQRAKMISMAYGDIGVVYDYSGDFEKALKYYHQQLEICEKHNLKMEKAAVIGNIGVIYHLKGDLITAKTFYEEKLNISNELGKINEVASALNNIGYLYKDRSNYSKALKYFKKSRTISRGLKDNLSIANSTINIGHVYKMQNDYQRSEKEFLDAIEISERFEYKHLIAEGMTELADLYFQICDRKKAEEYCQKGLRNAKDIGFGEYIEKGEALLKKIKKDEKL
ncbi:MAG: tetratricopeptide repeat protein, partial [Candidatus Delongbacteria bacterium]